MPKKNLQEIYKRNKARIGNNSSFRKKITVGSKGLKIVKPPKVSGIYGRPMITPRIKKAEKRLALEFLLGFLEYDAKNDLDIAEIILNNKRNCLNSRIALEIVDYYKNPKKEKLFKDKNPRIITTFLFKPKRREVYFWIRSYFSVGHFQRGIYQFYLIIPPEKCKMKVEELEGIGSKELEEIGFEIMDLLNDSKYEEFFLNLK